MPEARPRIPEALTAMIDEARGDVPRERWIIRALERALGAGQGEGKDVDRASGASTVGSTFGSGTTIRTSEPVRLPDSTPKAKRPAPTRAPNGKAKRVAVFASLEDEYKDIRRRPGLSTAERYGLEREARERWERT